MARYRKIDSRVWNDEKFRALSDDGKLAFLFVLTHPAMTAMGAMRATPAGLGAELGWKPRRFELALDESIEREMIHVDLKAAYLETPNFLRYNEPEGPNSVKAWLAALDLVPECSLKARLLERCLAYLEGKSEAFRNAIGEAMWDAIRKGIKDAKRDASRHPSPIPEQEQEPITTLGGVPPGGSNGKHGDPLLVEFETEIKPVYPKRDGEHRWKRAFSGYRSARKAGESLDVVRAGVERYSAYCERHQLTGTRSVKQAATFFGEEKSWREEWTVPDVPERPYTPA